VAGPDYRLGNGDVLDVQIAGRLDVSRVQVIVDPEGNVNIPPLGSIEVGGLSLLEANRKVSERARGLLRFADVSITVSSPRVFDVTVSGEVERPGTLQAQATQRLHELVLNAGGITPRGSARHVDVTTGGTTRQVDLLRFELGGDVSQNPYVVDNMRVHVPARGPAITLAGAVRRPGEYELGPDGSLRELLALTGGLAPGGAGSDARLTRIGADGRKETVSVEDTMGAVPYEGDLAAYAEVKAFPIIPCTLCGSQENLQRKHIKAMLGEWEKRHPGRIENILRSLQNSSPSHLLDRSLFDFSTLGPATSPATAAE